MVKPQLRIAVDGRSLYGERTGVGTYTFNLLEQLLLLDPSVTILLVTDHPLPTSGWVADSRVRVVNASFPWHNNFLWSNLALSRQIRLRHCDVFHSPGYTLPLWLPVPTVVTIHDVSYAAHPEWYPHGDGAIRRAWYRHAARTADIILTVSEFSRREIVRIYGVPSERVLSIPLGVDPGRFRKIEQEDALASLRQRYKLYGDFLLFVGDMHRRRNVERISEAFGLVKDSDAKFQALDFVFIGRVLESAFLAPKPASGQGGSIRLLGYVPEEDLALFYSLAKAFVFPSLYEGFGLGALEAMSCGCPVIVGRGTACEEVAGKAAVCVDPTETKSIADAISLVLNDPIFAASHSKAGLERSRNFRWARVAQETQAVYHQLTKPGVRS
jgi:glycosyltransferase involved in cell wall biosynthesis